MFQIGKYSHVGSHPFIYINGAASRASPTKSLKLIELLTKKPTVSKEEESKENHSELSQTDEKTEDTGVDGYQVEGESATDPIR